MYFLCMCLGGWVVVGFRIHTIYTTGAASRTRPPSKIMDYCLNSLNRSGCIIKINHLQGGLLRQRLRQQKTFASIVKVIYRLKPGRAVKYNQMV